MRAKPNLKGVAHRTFHWALNPYIEIPIFVSFQEVD
jgi:hypothetical protein